MWWKWKKIIKRRTKFVKLEKRFFIKSFRAEYDVCWDREKYYVYIYKFSYNLIHLYFLILCIILRLKEEKKHFRFEIYIKKTYNIKKTKNSIFYLGFIYNIKENK